MTTSQALIQDFESESANSRKMLERVPAEHFGWKPHEKSMTLGQLAGHIAEMPTWAPSVFEDELDFAEIMGDYEPFVPETPEELLTVFDSNRATFSPLLEDKDDDVLATTWTMRMGDKVLMQKSRADVLREILIHHAAHHRGQLSVYLRMLDVPVPATYGGTADTPGM